jgi:N-acetylglutamate synthase-like GNAT family acetyltransferase
MIRSCTEADLPALEAIISKAASAYYEFMPEDCWQEPYMTRSALLDEMAKGVEFWGLDSAGSLVSAMGLQNVHDVAIIRHSYVLRSHRSRGVCGALLGHLLTQTTKPLLVWNCAAAHWAVRFYKQHGFRLVDPEEKDRLIRSYLDIPMHQRETSVVLMVVRS